MSEDYIISGSLDASDIKLFEKASDLISDIYKFKREKASDLTMMETIIEYSYSTGLPLQEIGNLLAEHEPYKKILKSELIRDNFFKDETVLIDNSSIDEEEW